MVAVRLDAKNMQILALPANSAIKIQDVEDQTAPSERENQRYPEGGQAAAGKKTQRHCHPHLVTAE